ncbi:alpha-amylase [Candidatus Pacearchaeota archaeon]|nr:MAG: alpha-amylase [Candidatus Pacearchaeota archaeon]
MVSVCFYFQVHQPFRVRKYRVFDIGSPNYFSYEGESNLNNKLVLEKVARKCYIPANKLLLKLLRKHEKFKVSFSLSGVVIEQFERFFPEVLDSFKELVKTGKVELLGETYYHSLAFLKSRREFVRQVKKHERKLWQVFKIKPQVFRNTELIYNNELARVAGELGYSGVLAEGHEKILGWRSPNFVYSPAGAKRIKLLLKNYKLSDDIAFRFSERSWSEWPLTASKFSAWVSALNGNADTVNLFMDYETFGEHQWQSTGIFEFLESLPKELLKHPDNDFKTPSEVIASYPARDTIDAPYFISWADIERDLSAWLGNKMQLAALNSLYSLEQDVMQTRDEALIDSWAKLQTSDHFYYMCTKWFSDGDVHKYFNPYESPYDAFINFMNVLNDLKARIDDKLKRRKLLNDNKHL